jgi:RNA polymerase sigma-70 factor (ECF subfamily)
VETTLSIGRTENARVRTGVLDQGSEADFFAAEYERLVRALYLLSGDWHAAEDAGQEAFARLLAARGGLGRIENPAAWVRKVAVRWLFRQRSKVSRERPHEIQSSAPEPTSSPRDSSIGMDIVAALRRLPLRQRTAIAFFYLEDRSLQEIATIMDCSENTVKAHLNKARVKLRPVLEEKRNDH